MEKDIEFKRLLVPTDGSQFARKALSHAINIAKKFGAKIYVISVVDTADFPPGMLLALLERDKILEESSQIYDRSKNSS